MRRKTLNIVLFLYLFFLILNLAIALTSTVPSIEPDELTPLGVSAFLAGRHWPVPIYPQNYYGYIISFIYAPFFVLIDDPIILYKVLISCNAVLVSFIPVIAYKTMNVFCKDIECKYKVWISIVVGLQPCYLTASKRAWNETIVFLMVWLVLYFFAKCLMNRENRKDKFWGSFGIALSLVIGYMAHGRFLGVIVTTVIHGIVYWFLNKRSLYNPIVFGSIIVTGGIGDRILKSYLLKHVYLLDGSEMIRNTLSETLIRILKEGISLDIIKSAASAFSGYTFYLLLASCGILVLGTIFLFVLGKRCFFNKEKSCVYVLYEQLFWLGLFVFTLILMAITMTVLFFIDFLKYNISSYYYYIYGRYSEYLIAPFIMYSFITLLKINVKQKTYIVSLFLIVLNVVGTYLDAAQPVLLTPFFSWLNTPVLVALMKSYKFNNTSEFAFVCIMIVFLSLLLFYFCINNKKNAILLCCFFFCICNFKVVKNNIIEENNRYYENIETSYTFFNSYVLKNIVRSQCGTIYISNLNGQYKMLLKDYDLKEIHLNGEEYVGDIGKNGFLICQEDQLEGLGELNQKNALFQLDISAINQEKIFAFGDKLIKILKSNNVMMQEFN